ncbi:MAG: GNAT family N-acetyltransferase, partial [Stenotrophomonas maltophilia]
AVMQRLSDWMQAHLPPSAYVSLLADGEAHRLYAQYGFAATAPASIGMYRRF